MPQGALDPLEAVRLVREAGGAPVIAHPMSTMRGPALSLEYLGLMVELAWRVWRCITVRIRFRTVRLLGSLRVSARRAVRYW